MTKRWMLTTVALGACTLAGCSALKMSRVSDDWEQVDRQRVKRLVVVTAPFAAGDEKVAEMWSTLAARYVDLKRNFIIKDKAVSAAASPDLAALCTEGVEGVLWLRPGLQLEGRGAEAQVQGRLLRCVDQQEVWAADAAGSWVSAEPKLEQTIAQYVDEYGPSVQPYVAPSYYVLQAALDSLPEPELTEDDQSEKIENAQ
ncbi:MAG: MXAN_6521/LA_1396 family lipoprotein [Myxococcaceae bacterium]